MQKKNLIERAYAQSELAVFCEDEAGPYSTLPYPGQSWQVEGEPQRYPHEYIKAGTAKMLTLFEPKSGKVWVKGVTSSPNEVLHGWLKEQLSSIVGQLPPVEDNLLPAEIRAQWESWQAGLITKPSLGPLVKLLPPLRGLLIMDNLAGHHTPEFIVWLFEQGIMPLFTPLGGSWLNMAESIQRILKRRGLEGQHPETPEQIMSWLEQAAEGWNKEPTPFEWGGKRRERRRRLREKSWQRRQRLGGSGALALHILKGSEHAESDRLSA